MPGNRSMIRGRMAYKLRKIDGAAVLDLDGKLKMGESVDQFRALWTEAINGGAKVLIINFSSVPIVDSSGLGSLMRCYSSLKAGGGRIKLVGVNETVRQMLSVTHLDKLFQFYDDEAGALASMQTASAP
jgi:anti-sigma B factor antagonist